MVRLLNIIVPALQQQPTVRQQQQQQQEQQLLQQPCRHMHVPLVFMNTINLSEIHVALPLDCLQP